MSLRTTTHGLYGTTGLSGSLRVTSHGVFVLSAKHGLNRVTSHGVTVLQGTHGPTRVSTHGLIALTSIHHQIKPNFLAGAGEIFAAGFEQATEPLKVPEFNPYRPTTSSGFADLPPNISGFLGEQTETIRQQHDLIQAGDTTFPWHILAQVQDSTNRLFTPGSVGRFYHDTLGIILARYVQFKNLSNKISVGSPIGFLKSAPVVNWQVTDRIDLSSPDTPAGILAAYDSPKENGFGWVIVNGPAITSIPSVNGPLQKHGTPFIWDSTGAVSADASGRILGRLQGNQTRSAIGLGAFLVEIESWSKAQILNLFSGDFSSINKQLDELQALVDQLTDSGGDVSGALKTINANITNLADRIAKEESRRQAADTSLSDRINSIDHVTQQQFNTAINNLTLELHDSIADVAALANQALQGIMAVNDRIDNLPIPDLSPILDSIRTLQFELDQLNLAARFPVVDGATPPNLVYLDDGNLVYINL